LNSTGQRNKFIEYVDWTSVEKAVREIGREERQRLLAEANIRIVVRRQSFCDFRAVFIG
jgi:hypothetical protein